MSRARRPAVHLVTSGAAEDGRGHVSRALALAEALVAAGAAVTFEMRRGLLTDVQRRRQAELGVGVAGGDDGHGPSSVALRSDGAVVVVDIPDPNEVVAAWVPDRLVIFDDRERFRGEAAIIVQPSLPAWNGTARAHRVLAGYAYAPIRAGLLDRAARDSQQRVSRNVVVCFGGSDPADVSGRLVPTVARAVAGAAAGMAAGTVAIVGPGYAGSLRSGTTWSVARDPADLDRQLAGAALALIGGGTMKLELAMLGVPAIVVAVADDQLPVGPPFAATGAARYLGDGRSIDPGTVAAAVVSLLADADARRAMTGAGRTAIDGRGAERIVAVILELERGL